MKNRFFLTTMALLMGIAGVWAQTVTKVASASELTAGLYIIKDAVTNSAQEERRGYVYMNTDNFALLVNTTDRNKAASEILGGNAYSVEYIWRLTKASDKWTIECADGSHRYFPSLTGNGRMNASTTAGQYIITDHASGSGMLSLKSGNTYVNADPGFLAGWGGAHEMELYRLEGVDDAAITITYQLGNGTVVANPSVNIPSCKATTDLTYQCNMPDGYGMLSRNGNTVTVAQTLRDGQTYYIASDNRSAQYYLHYNGSGLGLHNGKEVSTAYMWTCVRNGNYYTFRNVESGKWLAYKTVANNAYNFAIDPREAVTEGRLPLYAVADSRYMLTGNNGNAFNQSTVKWTSNTDWTSDYVFTECDPMDVLLSESIDEPNWVMISNSRNPSYMLTVRTGDQAGTLLHSSTESTGDGQLFALVGNNQDGFYIYNKMLGSGYTLTAANTNDGTAVTWAAGATTRWYLSTAYLNASANAGYVLSTAKAGTTSMNMHGGAGNDIKFYNSSDDGSRWSLSVVDDTPTVIHYAVTGTKKYDDANQWVGKLKIQKGSYQSESYVTEAQNGTTFNAYLPKSSDALTFSNYDLHGWTFRHEVRDGQHYITYTADQETEYQYLGFRPDAQWYRIPAIVSARNGELVSIYDYRVCHNDVGFGEVDQVMRRSSDFGRTWSAEQKIADGNGGGKVFGAAFGDPALVADRESGRMTLLTVSGTTAYPNATATDHNLIAVQFSLDNGKTWSEPRNITSQFWGAASGMFADADTDEASATFAYAGFFGSGKLLQSRVTKVGDYYRIYGAMLCRGKNVKGAYVVYSDDMGETWQLLGGDNTVQAAPGSDEPKVEELPNGDVLLSCRKYNGRYFNIWHWTTQPTADDKQGAGQWGTVVDSNTIGTGIKVGGNSCNGEILYVECQKADGTPAKLMLQSLPSGNDRSGVEIWYKDVTEAGSYSDVQTFASNWTRGLRVSPQSSEDGSFSAYSTMTVQQDGRIGFLYEEGPATYCIVYVPLSLSDITRGAYKANPVSLPSEAYIRAASDLKAAYDGKASVQPGDGSSWLDYVASDPAALAAALAAAAPYQDKSVMELFKASPAVTVQDLEAMTAALDAVTLVQKCRKGCFVRLQGYSGNYVSLPADGTNGKMSPATDKTTILYLSPEGQLVSYGTGLGLYQTSIVAPVGASLSRYTVSNGARSGKYYLKSDASGMGTYLYDNTANGTKVDRNGSAVTSGSYQTDWSLEEVTTLPITMNRVEDAYYGTIHLPVAVKLPAGLKAYSAVASGDVLNLTKVADGDVAPAVLAAKTPVILYAAAAVDALAVSDEAGVGAGANELLGTVAAVSVASGANCVLSGKNGNVGFYLYSGTTMPGFKAYLPTPANVREFRFVFDEDVEDAIRAIESEHSGLEIYNLAGQKVGKAGKGIYIVGGKKVSFR